MGEPEKKTAQIIPFDPIERERLWPVERINGVKTHLGNMSVEQLTLLANYCRTREEEAHMDRLIVEDHIDARTSCEPEGF